MRIRPAALALLVALSGTGAHAQRIEGVVTLPDGRPATSVVVEAMAVDGGTAGRTLTDDGGRFFIELPTAGRFGLRVLRIGHRPTVVAPRDVAAGARVPVRIALAAQPIALDEVRVGADTVCSSAWRGDLAVVTVWEEARKALRVAELTARHSTLAMTVQVYEALATREGVVHEQTRSAYWRDESTVRPFEAVGEERLVREGYVVAGAEGTEYRAPDFDALLAPSFAATHCMRLVRATARPGEVGLAFEPNLERTRSDIAGVLWVDRATAALREIEFRFTGLPGEAGGARESRQGGAVRFRALPSGHWIIDRWELRMPRPLEEALTVTGGEVGEVRQGEDVVYASGTPIEDIYPTPVSMVAMACGEEALEGKWGLLRGEAIREDGLPAAEARIRVSWRDGLGFREVVVPAARDGSWRACRVPFDVDVQVDARLGDSEGHGEARLDRDMRVRELVLTLGRGRR